MVLIYDKNPNLYKKVYEISRHKNVRIGRFITFLVHRMIV